MSEPNTVPDLVWRTLLAAPDRVRLQWREPSVQRKTARDVAQTVSAWSRGLVRDGVQPGDRIGILAPSSAHWLMFDLAALCARAVTVPLFANVSRENLLWQIRDSGMRWILVDSSQLDLIQSLEITAVKILVLQELDHRLSVGADSDGNAFDPSKVKPEDHATLIYTSGSTGRPKGVLLDHRALYFQVRGAQTRYPTDPVRDSAASCLPLSHVFERIVAYFHLANGYALAVATDVQKVGEDLKEFQPTIFTAVPRLLEKMLLRVRSQVEAASPIRRRLGRLALSQAAAPAHAFSPLLDPILDRVAWSKVRSALGGKLRMVVCGGAALPLSLEASFNRMGIPVYNGYGMTENGPVISANTPDHARPGSVGLPFPAVEVRIASDGEILVRSESILREYWNQPEETRKIRTEDGWLFTGDLGRIDSDGYIFITGRKKDLCKTAGGKYVAPSPLEESLASHPLIEHAVICADGRKFVSAVLSLDQAAFPTWARARGLDPAIASATPPPALAFEIDSWVAEVNSRLDEWEKIRKWILTRAPLTIEGNELTPTLKVRRQAVLDKYRPELDGLYVEGEARG
ncbi:MAG: long-chain fatty acid--CoA ligase [Fibrobacteres bacterium]|nr:long-chain fatty acid--CoA ligase [Fibrobacterota bacterium]